LETANTRSSALISWPFFSATAPNKRVGVTYEVQSGGALQPSSFSSATTTVLIDSSTTLKVRDNIPVSNSTGRFMRVKVTASP